jgi:hypothetical protein
MPNPFNRNKESDKETTPTTPTEAKTPDTVSQGNEGETPQSTGGDNSGTDKPQGEVTPLNDQSNNGDSGTPPVVETPKTEKSDPPKPQEPGKTKRIQCAAIAGQKIVIGDKTVLADADGIIEVDEAQYKRLLTIPGWKEA